MDAKFSKVFYKKKIKTFIQMGSSGEYGKIKSPHHEKFQGKSKNLIMQVIKT